MQAMESSNTQNKAAQKPENMVLNIGFNIGIPAILMMKGAKWFGMDPALALAVALAFPIIYGIWDLIMRKKVNFFSVLGFVSVLLTGGIGLLELSKEWIAVKEAAIPAVVGVAILFSMKPPYPLVGKFLLNEHLVDMPKIKAKLAENEAEGDFEQLLGRSTFMLAGSFFLSAVLNFVLAKVLIQSETGTTAFNEELGQMTLWSYPVIVLPCTVVLGIALWRLMKGIQKLTGLEFEAILLDGKKAKVGAQK